MIYLDLDPAIPRDNFDARYMCSEYVVTCINGCRYAHMVQYSLHVRTCNPLCTSIQLVVYELNVSISIVHTGLAIHMYNTT